METKCVVLVGSFLLLVVAGCSGDDSKGNGDEKTGLDRYVDGKEDPVIERGDSKSIPDSVKDNGRDQSDGSERGVDIDASKSDLDQQLGSNEGKNLVKGGKEFSVEVRGNANSGKYHEGDQLDESKGGADNDASKSDLDRQSGSNEGKNLVKDGKNSGEVKGNTSGEDNGGDPIDGSKGGADNDANKSDLNRQSGSNEGKNLVKDGKELSSEAKGYKDSEKDNGGDQIDRSKGGADKNISKIDLNQELGSNEGKNLIKDGKQSSGEAKGITNSGIDNGDQTDGSKGGADNDASKSNLNQELGANEGKNLVKDGKESSGEAKGNTNSERDHGGDQTDGLEGGADSDASKSDLNQKSGSNEGKNLVKDGKESSGEAKGYTISGKDHGGDQIDESEGGADSDASKSDLNQKSSSNEGKNSLKDGKEELTNSRKDKGSDQIDGSEKGPKKVSEEEEIIQGSVQPPPPLKRKDSFQVAECDSSNMCTTMNKKFAACLRVAGNDSPSLLLLVQNKGKGPLNLKISAPPFVQLEEKDVELEENQDKKVKISIMSSGTGNLIVLDDGTGECSIDFKDFIPQNLAKSYVNFLSLTPTTAFIFAAAILILVSCWMSKSFRWRPLAKSGPKYQKLDVGLPVSNKVRREPEVNDGWDNSWGDNWDDEEAPVTPSMPKTPSVSSKGLASRRLSKEGWKD